LLHRSVHTWHSHTLQAISAGHQHVLAQIAHTQVTDQDMQIAVLQGALAEKEEQALEMADLLEKALTQPKQPTTPMVRAAIKAPYDILV
jgi:hypothetical protein